MPVYLEVVLFEVGLFDEEELLEGALFEDGGLVDGDCDGLEDVVLHVELSVPGPHPGAGGVGPVLNAVPSLKGRKVVFPFSLTILPLSLFVVCTLVVPGGILTILPGDGMPVVLLVGGEIEAPEGTFTILPGGPVLLPVVIPGTPLAT